MHLKLINRALLFLYYFPMFIYLSHIKHINMNSIFVGRCHIVSGSAKIAEI